MSSIIKLKRSLTPGSVPGSLQAGELAINIPDKKLYSSNGSSVFNVSGDQYNAITAANTQTGGADIILTVDNAALTNDRISLIGGTGTSINRAANGAITIAVTGEGGAAALSTARDIALDGAVSGTVSFDGSQNVTITTTIADSITANTSGTAAAATVLATARNIGGVSFNGSADINLPGVNATGNQDTSGNAATATALETARNIGGVSFDGSADITLPGVNATGDQDTTGSAATLTTARNIGGVSFDGSADITLPGVNATGDQDTSGNAASATALETARNIGGVSFDGSADINLPGVNAAGNQDTSGNAATATALETARAIAIAGDVTGTANFDGTAGITITVAQANDSVDLGTHTTGNYAASVTGTANEIEITGTAGEGTNFQIGLPSDVTIGNDLTVTRAVAVGGNLTVDGNLEVNGTLTYIDSNTVAIGDNMIKLANNNVTDSTDLGFYSRFNDGADKFTGLVRDATNGEYTLFTDLATEPDQTINFGSATTATLNVVVDGGTF
jgi:hypothetical protein